MSAETNRQNTETVFEFPVDRPKPSDLAKKIKLTYDKMGYRSLRNVYCETEGNHIILRGETTTFYLKQVAQVITAKVAGVESINNQITVLSRDIPE